MISVIIPTMWKSELIADSLKQLVKHDLVGEIILIDNYEGVTPIKFIDSKILHIREGKNTYVNPAWNKGVKLARFDKILIMNDDVDTDMSVIDLVYPFITPENGMIGSGTTCWKPYYHKDSTPDVVETRWRTVCYGCLFFIHKESYTPIPDTMKIWFGDDWLFRKSGKPNYQIQNWFMGGDASQTVNSLPVSDILQSDRNAYYTEMNKHE